jgi:hypothetical protein
MHRHGMMVDVSEKTDRLRQPATRAHKTLGHFGTQTRHADPDFVMVSSSFSFKPRTSIGLDTG